MGSFRGLWYSSLLVLAGSAFASDADPAFCSYHPTFETAFANHRERASGDGGIKEIVPAEYRDKYRKWKAELLATEFGRQQWEYYANNKEFALTIAVSAERKFGAGTDGYEWNDDGELIAATITLGKDLDRGYPDPVYYPVMNSLATYNSLYEIPGNILASTKFIHEIGHVNSTRQANSKQFQRQNKLIATYNKIFLNNGYDTSDPRLVDLANELGGNPIEIWEDREYWSEVSAMRYLLERISNESFYCFVYSRMSRNIRNYARNYRDRFEPISNDFISSGCKE